jgi:hypothetical protein
MKRLVRESERLGLYEMEVDWKQDAHGKLVEALNRDIDNWDGPRIDLSEAQSLNIARHCMQTVLDMFPYCGWNSPEHETVIAICRARDELALWVGLYERNNDVTLWPNRTYPYQYHKRIVDEIAQDVDT